MDYDEEELRRYMEHYNEQYTQDFKHAAKVLFFFVLIPLAITALTVWAIIKWK